MKSPTKKVAFDITIDVSPATIIRAFSEPELLKGWWGVERSLIELRQGGPYTLAWQISDQGFGYVSSGVVRRYVPERELDVGHMVYLNPGRAILGPMSLTVRTEPASGGASLHVIQDGYQSGGDWDWYYQAVVEAWPQALKGLKAFLEAL